jgi:FkbM family methyltransferase
VKIVTYLYKILNRVSHIFGISYSFSSDGEDYVLNKYLQGIKNGNYVDIGSNHPIRHSNTFLFYLMGWRGICIDPIPQLKSKYQKLRPNDVFINAGIMGSASIQNELKFYYYKNFPDNSTFDSKRVKELERLFNRKPTSVTDIPVISVSNLVDSIYKKNSNEKELTLLSLDTEGFEFEILEKFFSSSCYPWVVCVEELGHTAESVLNGVIYKLMSENNYMLGAKTFLSSIYIRKDVLKKMPSVYVKELAECIKSNFND